MKKNRVLSSSQISMKKRIADALMDGAYFQTYHRYGYKSATFHIDIVPTKQYWLTQARAGKMVLNFTSITDNIVYDVYFLYNNEKE